MKTSETLIKISPALVKAQTEIEAASKGSKNPFFKSRYADLTEVIKTIKEPLNNNGISFLQIVDRELDGAAVVETVLLHTSGEFISGRTPVFTAKPNDPQALGSGITYSKRYGLQSICGLPTEDDDGEAAMARRPKVNTNCITELKLLVKKLGKTPEAIANMRKHVKASEGTTLEGLTPEQASKLLDILKKRV